MGVKECFRKDCENIMCDRYSDEHGYICDECFEDLVNTGLFTDIHNFMESTKTPKSEKKSARFRYETEFRITS